ncbi:transposase [Fusicatenibacter saccharivorans]|nr:MULTISPECIES: transposase [Lachnospiraceae]MCB5527869.1 transposase [Fusicatenibacter saccharivorans]MCB5673632.1 transposase [Fusicatenibacter saccharivorans]MCB5692855.1 transposase [Fusicatenibacter saccharivorans]MCB5696415.1 transposase [Fusicatenibacter saccharivorans]MCC2732014.1 transposase [Fusicatenibacter saccharivorans]
MTCLFSPKTKNLVSWAGCCPRNNKIDRKIKSSRISRAVSYFKPVLAKTANTLIKSKKNSEFSTRYRRIKARRGHQKAIIAICRRS